MRSALEEAKRYRNTAEKIVERWEAEKNVSNELRNQLAASRETLRDRFAMAALPSIVSNDSIPTVTACGYAYEVADAMLAARKAKP